MTACQKVRLNSLFDLITHNDVGQYKHVLERELPEIKAACKSISPTYKPKISIIVVGKRHHTRFYPTDEAGSDGKTGNCRPGTVVDRGVTAVYDFDFYLQAHAGIKGTARPAHYYVIHNEHRFDANTLQTMVSYYTPYARILAEHYQDP